MRLPEQPAEPTGPAEQLPTQPAAPLPPTKPAAPQPAEAEVKPVGHGVFGDIYDQFKGKVKEAAALLIKLRNGVAKGALRREPVGEIDLVIWGEKYRRL